ncbi:MAG: hypothetical protein ACYCVD_12870 [Desulfitobacteriaceae bacterium]
MTNTLFETINSYFGPEDKTEENNEIINEDGQDTEENDDSKETMTIF